MSYKHDRRLGFSTHKWNSDIDGQDTLLFDSDVGRIVGVESHQVDIDRLLFLLLFVVWT